MNLVLTRSDGVAMLDYASCIPLHINKGYLAGKYHKWEAGVYGPTTILFQTSMTTTFCFYFYSIQKPSKRRKKNEKNPIRSKDLNCL